MCRVFRIGHPEKALTGRFFVMFSIICSVSRSAPLTSDSGAEPAVEDIACLWGCMVGGSTDVGMDAIVAAAASSASTSDDDMDVDEDDVEDESGATNISLLSFSAGSLWLAKGF